jgi:hypothetical protein
MYQMILSNDMTMFIYSMGKRFKVTNVCQDVNKANEICEENPLVGVISEDDEGNIYIAELLPTETLTTH